MEKMIKLTIRDEDIIEMERIKSRDNLTDDELFSYLLRLDAVADMDSLTPTSACIRSSERARPVATSYMPGELRAKRKNN